MVFSFFKKKSQKMPERPVAHPKAPVPKVQPKEAASVGAISPQVDIAYETHESSSSGVAVESAARVEEKKAVKPLDDLDFEMDEFDRSFTDSSVMAIDVDHDLDPVQADLEQAVVLFANGQEAAARGLLEALIRTYPGNEGRRFWHLLFDLLQIEGDRAAFEKLGFEFAQVCETSPPAWRQGLAQSPRRTDGPQFISLQGVLTADGSAPLSELESLIEQGQSAIVDCGKLINCDDDIAGNLAELLTAARRAKLEILLDQPEAFLRRLNDRLIAGEPAHASSWLLLLELLQRHGTQEAFEERAIDYAVTFELSPPSWVAIPPAKTVKVAEPAKRRDGAYYFSGDLKACRFEELIPVIEGHDSTILDFSGVRRMDFFSAGQLVNRLVPFKAAGQEVVVRSPNHLVAELMVVVGVNKQARIIFPKS